jgi:hypothetical protein
MKAPDIELWIYSRAVKAVSIEQRHAQVMARMVTIGSPLGFSGITPPPTPDCGENLSASYHIKPTIKGLKAFGNYKFRGERYEYRDSGKFDDLLVYGFKLSNKALDYRSILQEHFPQVIEAFEGYRATVEYGSFGSAYCGGYEPSEDGATAFDSSGNQVRNNPVYNRLLTDKTVDLDGRNNIYLLNPAMYWDAELCQRALGYGRDEVIRRLDGLVTKVEPLMDGVYVVFNDNPALSYQDFLTINERFKPVLGLI